MPTVGPGVREIRIHDEAGAFRLLYVTRIADAIYVLHAFPEEDAADGEEGLGLGRVAAAADLGE